MEKEVEYIDMEGHIHPPRKIYISQSRLENGGRGVFASESIFQGECIERCPVIPLSDPKDRARLRRTGLVNYYFLWGDSRERTALCLGWGSVYNHSFSPNARYEKNMEEGFMDFYALRDISSGEEILVNYNGNPADTRRLRIPGIPAEEGGPLPVRAPRIVDAILRRVRLCKEWFLTKNGVFCIYLGDALLGSLVVV